MATVLARPYEAGTLVTFRYSTAPVYIILEQRTAEGKAPPALCMYASFTRDRTLVRSVAINGDVEGTRQLWP